MKMEQIECSETSAHKIQTPENYSEESIQHSERGESSKLRIRSSNLFGFLTLEDGADRLSQNVINKLPQLAA